MEKPAKVVLLGEGRVGKTSLLLRYINNTYTDKQPSTIQAHFLSKRLVINDERVTLNVWDTAGQEKVSRIKTFIIETLMRRFLSMM
eukprot:EC720443.1.p1 GENE.EC720443.1~~EC720443.1.p1  ORF type:complete len:86 (+),score=16.13 EC720443.1:96-353(+)